MTIFRSSKFCICFNRRRGRGFLLSWGGPKANASYAAAFAHVADGRSGTTNATWGGRGGGAKPRREHRGENCKQKWLRKKHSSNFSYLNVMCPPLRARHITFRYENMCDSQHCISKPGWLTCSCM